MKCYFGGMVCFFLLSVSGFGADQPSKDTHSVLFYRTNTGYEETQGFSIMDGILSTKTKKTPVSELLPLRDLISVALSVDQKSRSLDCTSGEYFHAVYLKGKRQLESGCLDDSRFALLSQAFDQLD